VSIGPSPLHDPAARTGRRAPSDRGRAPLRSLVARRFAVAARRIAPVAAAMLAAMLIVTPVLGAAVGEQANNADDGGYVPVIRQLVVPSIEMGLTQSRPIPLGATCSCTLDRVGLTSQYDITVLDVVQDAYGMVQQLNRFNRPARPGARYVAAYVGQQYIAGPQSQAYTISTADWHATTTDQRLSDVSQLIHTEMDYRPRADVYAVNYVNGWLYFELPVDRPAFLVWNYNFVGERGIWFALQ
jgi:hypothetical protein